MIRLGINIDHIATIRQARRGHEPDPVTAAALAFLGGADGITVHLREDRRHIQDRDVDLLRLTVPFGLNLEMCCSPEMVEIALRVKPDQVTLVPEKRQELTTEGGLDVVGRVDVVRTAVERLNGAGIPVALFVDPDLPQVDLSAILGAVAVEFHTGQYCEARTKAEVSHHLELLTTASARAAKRGLQVHMGHGLNYVNVQAVCAIPEVEEVNIGHSVIARAAFVGITQAVRDMKEAIRER